jgi:hypothetical protein
MSCTFVDLQLAQERVAQDEVHVLRLKKAIRRLSHCGHRTEQGEHLLRIFENTLLQHRAECDRVRAELASTGRSYSYVDIATSD